jgi:hypothetical protein
MRGTLEIDQTSGAITESKLSQVEEGASISELSQEKIQHIGLLLTSILQDVATYMRQKNLNTLEHMTLNWTPITSLIFSWAPRLSQPSRRKSKAEEIV